MNEQGLRNRLSEKYRDLEVYYMGAGFSFSFMQFIFLVIALSFASAVVFILLNLKVFVAVIGFIAVLSLVVSLPITFRNARIARIDESLPDVLKHMAAVLKAGGTTESALEEVSNSDYGPLSDDLKMALRQLREGRAFDEVMEDAAGKTGSHVFKRCISIILGARRAGAGLAEVMGAIADDAKELLRVKRERYSRTTMHVMFLFISSLFISPFIFGFSLSIVCYMGSGMISATGQMPVSLPDRMSQQQKYTYCESQKMSYDPASASCIPPSLDLSWLNLLLTAFLAVQAIISAIAVGIIREGNAFKYSLYIPLLVLLSILMFEGGKMFSGFIIGGSISCLM